MPEYHIKSRSKKEIDLPHTLSEHLLFLSVPIRLHCFNCFNYNGASSRQYLVTWSTPSSTWLKACFHPSCGGPVAGHIAMLCVQHMSLLLAGDTVRRKNEECYSKTWETSNVTACCTLKSWITARSYTWPYTLYQIFKFSPLPTCPEFNCSIIL